MQCAVMVGVQVDDWLRFALIVSEAHPLCVLPRLTGTSLLPPRVLIVLCIELYMKPSPVKKGCGGKFNKTRSVTDQYVCINT